MSYRPYVPVAKRRKMAAALATKLKKKGRKLAPVEIQGRTIARSFWGKAWCDNLESYRDFESRMPRGRTYVRNGSVIDLQILPGKVTALVYGSEAYEVSVEIEALRPDRWKELRAACSGQVGSLVELLRGTVSSSVLQVLARPGTGIFPEPDEIHFHCSCLDWASMCKHIAAALYGVGARLDDAPALFFTLRQVDGSELVSSEATTAAIEVLGGDADLDLGALGDAFDIEFEEPAPEPKRRRR